MLPIGCQRRPAYQRHDFALTILESPLHLRQNLGDLALKACRLLSPIEAFSGALGAIAFCFPLADDAGHLTGARAHLVDGEALTLQIARARWRS